MQQAEVSSFQFLLQVPCHLVEGLKEQLQSWRRVPNVRCYGSAAHGDSNVLPRRRGGSDTEFVRRVLIVIGITALAASLYKLSEVLLLIFGAMLIAVVIGPDAGGQ
jgi:hypothetical protein